MKRAKKVLLYGVGLVSNNIILAQGFGINTSGQLPHEDAILDLNSTPKKQGILIPRVQLTSWNDANFGNAPGNNPRSLLVYNIPGGTLPPGFYYWDTLNGVGQWVQLLAAPTNISSAPANAWLITGNAATNPTNHFLGTTDANDLVIRTNNMERVRVLSTGTVNIGVANPVAGRALHVKGGANNSHTALFENNVTNMAVGIGSVSNVSTGGSIQAVNTATNTAAPLLLQAISGGDLYIGTTSALITSPPTKVHLLGPSSGIGLYSYVASGAGVSGETNGGGPGNNGVEGYAGNPNNASAATGLLGYSDGPNGNGVYGECSIGTSWPLGIWGVSVRGNPNGYGYTNTNGYAGYFGLASTPNAGHVRILDNLSVVGNLSVNGTKAFFIDHPLDPKNKYLVHSCVESPDMLNIYTGIVQTNEEGIAIVKLPNYFQALNINYTYHLTPVGEWANVFVLQEINNNEFVIKSDKPNVKVSWMVTGIRNDPYAQKNRIQPEIEKPDQEKGYYLHPECYGETRSKFVDMVYMKDKEKPMLSRFAIKANR